MDYNTMIAPLFHLLSPQVNDYDYDQQEENCKS